MNETAAKIHKIIQQEQLFFGRNLTEQEIQAIHKRVAFELKHKGHEQQHSEMALILLGSLFVSQILIGIWKKRHPTSYHWATLFGLWWVPLFMGIKAGNGRFIAFHLTFSIANSWIMYKALERPLRSWVPKLVYAWYALLYKISYGTGVLGYIIVMIAFFHVPGLLTGARIDTEASIFEVHLPTLKSDFI